MIAVDTSALMVILLDKPEATTCAEAFATNDRIVISAATVTEALIVSGRRGLGTEMSAFLDRLDLEIASVSPATEGQVADAYAQWGTCANLVGLNFSDCFACEVAKT